MKRDTTRRRVKQVLAVACGLVAGTTVHAWVPTGGSLWPDGPVKIAVALEETAPAGLVGDFNGAALEAMNLWNVSLQRVRLTAVPPDGEAWYENGRNEVFFDRRMFDKAWPSGVLAVTATTEDRGVVVEADIVFNANVRWSVFRGNGQPGVFIPSVEIEPEVRRVAVHELGHLLGLGHPDEAGQTSVNAIMNRRVGPIEEPWPDDVAGVRALYDLGPGAPPVIVTQPKAVGVYHGATVSLSVVAGGRGPFSYEWRRNGVAVPGATEARLKFAAAPGDVGDYTVVVRSTAGATVSTVARVEVRAVQKPTAFVTVTSSMPVEAGSDLLLVGSFYPSEGSVELVWKKNGSVVSGATTALLDLKGVQFSDAGDYTLTVTNAAGSGTSTALSVTVKAGQPPRFTREVVSSAVAPGGAVTLAATVTGTGLWSGASAYQWFKDGVEIAGATKVTLDITQFGPADAGHYSMTATNGFGRVMNTAGELTGYEAKGLAITRQPVAVTEFTGATVSLAVEVEGAVTSYRWFKDGVLLAGASGAVLTLPSVGMGDAGRYSVEVSDGLNRERSTGARLTVLTRGVPIIVQQPSTHTVAVGGSVGLSVGVNAWRDPGAATGDNLAITYQWMKDGQPVVGQTKGGFSFVARASDAGRYRVKISTAAGSVESEGAEVVIVPTTPLIAVHPPSIWFGPWGESERLWAVNAEFEQRRAARDNRVYFFSRGGNVLTGSPYSLGGSLPGTYAVTAGREGTVETSRPFTLGFNAPGAPLIGRHPQGGAYAAGEAVTLRVTTVSAPGDAISYQWYRNSERLASGGATLVIPSFSARDLGEYLVIVSNVHGAMSSESARLDLRQWQSPIIRVHPVGVTVTAGEAAILSVVTRPGEFQFQWFKDGQRIQGASGAQIGFSAGALTAGSYRVAVTDGVSTATSRTAQVKVLAVSRPPELLIQPQNETTGFGGDVTFSAGADGAPLPDRYQWKKNGVNIPGATDAKLKLRDVTAEAAGAYSVVVTNSVGAVTSRAATLTVDGRGRLVNLATRAAVGRDGDVLFAGFVIGGTESRQVLVRGIGDQLSEFGVSGVLRDPVVSLYDATGKLVESNDDWFRLSEDKRTALEAAAKQVGAFAQREDARDGALLATLAPGSYTVKVAGLANTTGVGLVEVYELGKPGTGRLVNLSSRAVVGTGASILIPGLVLNGATPRRLLIRAVGPGLAEFGVAGTLSDPVMTVFRGSEEVARNDNWGEQTGGTGGPGAASVAQIRTTMAAVGAFGLKDGSRDAVLLLDLPPGSYTVQVAGVADATGVALVEVYEVAP